MPWEITPGQWLQFSNAILPPACLFVLVMMARAVWRGSRELIRTKSGRRVLLRRLRQVAFGKGGRAFALCFAMALLSTAIQADAVSDWRLAMQLDSAFPWARSTIARVLFYFAIVRSVAILAPTHPWRYVGAAMVLSLIYAITLPWTFRYLPAWFIL